MYGSVNRMVTGWISSPLITQSSQTTLCKLLELGWHRTTSDSSGTQCGSRIQVFSCVQSGMVGMSTVTYPMADSTGYHSKRFSGITHGSCCPSNSHCNRRAVSTSFLVLSHFREHLCVEKMLMKSVMGYAVVNVRIPYLVRCIQTNG